MVKQLADMILEYLAEHEQVSTLELASIFNEDHQKIIGAVKSLQTLEDFIDVRTLSMQHWFVTQEGQHVIDNGSPEASVYNVITDNGMPQETVIEMFTKVGVSKAIVAGWIEVDKSSGINILKRKVSSIVDHVQQHLKDINSISDQLKKEYKKRKLLQESTMKSMLLSKGPNFSTKIQKLEADVTADLLINGAWKEKKFKQYNFNALGMALEIGHLHPLLKVRSEFKKIFIEMGFSEMPTNNYVENSFWNFDALYQPQQHPARDAHDTFFISEPKLSKKFPLNYLENVRRVHSIGDYGSVGYRYNWKIQDAQKNLLRTHTTAVSARMLYKLMQEKGQFRPVKYFSIDRVFRNETLDATHLAEFHQVEGVVADYNLTLGDLIGTLYEFFNKLGISQLRFKPAYNPYTEPSMEIFCYHNGLGKWIECGNSGMFRPEMIRPMGVPAEVNVIAWGLSLERPTMIKYGINNIRDLVGPRVDMEMVHHNPLCRLDKTGGDCSSAKADTSETDIPGCTLKDIAESEDDSQIRHKKTERQEVIIFCDPNYPIYSLEKLLYHAKPWISISMYVHTHSSVSSLPNELLNFCSKLRKEKNVNTVLSVTLIWTIVGIDPIMHLSSAHKIMGEVNIARYINRLIEWVNPSILKYETKDVLYANMIDSYLDNIHAVIHGSKKLSVLNTLHKKKNYIMGDDVSIVDFVLESVKKKMIKK